LPWVNDTSRGRMLSSRVGAAQAALYEDDAAEPAEPVSLVARVKTLIPTMLPRGGMVLAVLFVANAVMALLRDKVLAHEYGAGPELDAFFTALILPQFVLEFLVVGGVVGPFLPLFMGLKNEAEATAREFARTILTVAILVMAVFMGIVFIFAPQTASFMAPGYSGEQIDMYANLLRVMCAGQVVFAASWVLGEILVAERKFLTYGLGDFMYNAGIVLGAVVLSIPLGIYGAAVGVLIGAFGHLGIRLVGIYRTSFRPRPSLALRTKGLGEFLRLMIPKMVSQPMGTLMLAYFASLASTLAPGSTTDFSFARNFQSVGESMVGLAFATAAFPALSAAVSAGDKRAFKKTFLTNMVTIGFFSTCISIGLLVFGGFAISFLLSGGAFDSTDVSQTTMILAILAISIPFESLVELFARGLFATHNTLDVMLAAWAGFVVGIGTTWILSSPIGLAAIPVGYTACRVAQLAVLAIALRPRMARIGGSSRWTRALVRDRWGGSDRRKALPAGQLAFMALLLITLTAGTAFTAAQALSHSTLVGDPQITPWARVGGTRAPVIISTDATPGSSVSVAPGQTAPAGPTSAPTPVGQFSMDLYQKGDFVSETKDTWCVPAAMQTSMNIMSATPDTTRDTQAKLWDLAVSMGGQNSGGADPVGWADGLASLGYGNYEVGQQARMTDAIHIVAKQIRVTQRPAGIIVWGGWHSWVVSGFTATADPALTDSFTVISIAYEDVWYPRVSKINPKSRPPDSTVLVSQLQPKSPASSYSNDYRPWRQTSAQAQGRNGQYVYVIPTN
jgi:putative peptidoglycan lipid II flippase